jgi:formamidopyrimidine-DNA glycosylase
MPELAEVEFYRRQWNSGLGWRILEVAVHPQARPLREVDANALRSQLRGTELCGSEARGKQMLFQCGSGAWLGIHLGLTGKLSSQDSSYQPERHDHLVLHLQSCALVFTDPRQFGRIRFHAGPAAPAWWTRLPPSIGSSAFTVQRMATFLERHARLSLKAALLLQDGFPGIGNWMADEILWRAGLAPHRTASSLSEVELRDLWRRTRFVCRQAMRLVAPDFSDPPRGWLFHQRWHRGGVCPSHRVALIRQTIGGRTTAWCSRCQR